MSDQAYSSPDGYQIRRELGRGATAIVYLAHDIKHDRLVALKVLQPNLHLTPTRFLAEIHTIAGLHHPHILPLHDSGVWDDDPFFVMPYVEGESLAERMQRDGALPISAAVSIAKEVGDALEYAHRHGVVHRDIKPANILLADGHAYVSDFGIAHVIRLAASERVTAVGLAVGTPAYMSPEQAAGERDIDGRSDLYSLGCVMYEMITGEPPFSGSNSRMVSARRMSNPPPGVRTLRPSVLPALESVVARMLEKSAADRYQTAGELVAELAKTEQAPPPVPDRRKSVRFAALAMALIGLGAAAWVRARRDASDDATLDRSTYAVFPFRHSGIAPNMWLDGDGCARLLHDAMARWQGVRLVDDMRVNDVWTRRQPRTVADVINAARSLRAGSLAWGEVIGVGDSLEIRAATYDVRGQSLTRQFVVRLAKDAPQLERAFSALADSILVGGSRVRESAARGTRNLAALEQFLAGREALDRFDLRLAERRFRDAAVTDESYANAHFWLARTLAWTGDAEPAAWAGNAAHAVALAAALPERDRAHASALLDLASGQMADACRRYRALIASDSLDFAAWFGLGDCNARDPIVVRDRRSVTGYAFRGSLNTAIAAYRRALRLVPSFHLAERGLAFSRLSRRALYTEESRLRRGIALLPDTQRFGAFPSFAAGSLAFVPSPYALASNAANRPTTERQAVIWSADTYRQTMADWERAFPSNADAQESHALALESASGISGSGGGASLAEALAAARRSLRTGGGADESVRRAAMVVRLLIKADSVPSARALADSMLGAWPTPTPYQAGYLAGLAAVTGRAARAAALIGRAASDSEHVPFFARAGKRAALPVEITSGALQLTAYASLGGPRDSVRAAFARTSRLVDSWIPVAERADVRQTIFRHAFGLAYGDLAPLSRWTPAPANDLVLAMRLAIAKGDTADARRVSRALTAIASSYSPGTMTIDRFYHHATMLLALGDTAGAITQLDAALGALPRTRSILLKTLPQAGAIVPLMVLRAELAWQARDLTTFDRWARPAIQLWSDADPELRKPIDTFAGRLRSPR